MRQLYQNDGSKYVRLYRLFAVSSLYFVLSVGTSGIYGGSWSGIWGLLINALMLSFGYGLMALWARIIRLRRKSDTRGYESNGGYFSLGRAFVPLVIIVVIGFFIMKLTGELEYLYAMNTPGAYYDPDSLLPYAGTVFYMVVMIFGVVLWFVPYERLVSQRTVFICVTVMFGVFVFYMGTAGPMAGVCLMGYILSAALALNQNSLTRTYRGTVTAFLTPQARRYNMRLALGFVLGVTLLMSVGYIVTVGLFTAGKAILYIIVHSMTAPPEVSYDPGETNTGALFSLYVFGAKKADDSVNYWIFIFFSIAVVLALVIFLLRRQAEMRRLLDSIKRLFLRLIDAIFSPVAGSMTYFAANMRDDVVNYVDTEEKLVQNARHGSGRQAERQRESYRSFLAGLRAAGDENARLRYAYSVFAAQLHTVPQLAKKSDTPRQLCGRVKKRRLYPDDEIAEITAAYEKAQYSGGADAAEAAAATEKLCRIIRRNMD